MPIRIATAQLPITGDARTNGRRVRDLMREAASGGARLVQFPEGMLSGYAKNPIQDWAEVDWTVVRTELEAVTELAGELGLWVVLGSAHPLTPPHWPHNSLYVISDAGAIVDRYDKRLCSNTELTRFYSPGVRPVVFDIDGCRFGCIICVEINFPTLFMEYDELDVHCLLLSAFPVDTIFHTKARAHAAIHQYVVSLSVPSECTHLMRSGMISPDGETLTEVKPEEGLVLHDLDLESADAKRHHGIRQWRANALAGLGTRYRVQDARSTDRATT